MPRQPLLVAAALALLTLVTMAAPSAVAGDARSADDALAAGDAPAAGDAFGEQGAPGQEAADAPPEPYGRVLLTVGGQEGDISWIRWVDLTCPGEVRGHPDPERACAELDQARGEVRLLARSVQPCTREYAPVTATATGTWRGRPVSWRETFGNTCELRSRTGAVFGF